MPKSKRDKKVSLTKTIKKGLPVKQQLVEEVRKCIDEYPNIFVFWVQNMRNAKLKELRGKWKDSRFFFGKNKVMALALGRSRQDEPHEKLHKLSAQLTGQCGLLFTKRDKEEVIEWFDKHRELDYAKAGFVAKEDVVLPEGALPDFPHSIEPHLRQLGLPTSLQKGVVTLIKEHTVCRSGDVLTPEQARILKLLGNQMAEFRVTLRCVWSNDGSFKKFKVEPKILKVSRKKPKEESESNDVNDVEMAEI